MSFSAGFSTTASLIADPARAMMLTALIDGRARPAGELAYAAGITPQTASSHLAKLLVGGLVAVEREGRHHYYRLAGSHVAQALEQLATIQPAQPVKRKALTPQARELRFCRCCYDHLAGQVGVAIATALVAHGYLVEAADKQFEVTASGAEWFGSIGLDLRTVKATRRGLARQCLDWTERQHHVAGPLGVQFLAVLCDNGWARRSKTSRAAEITPKGWIALRQHLGLDRLSIRDAGGDELSARPPRTPEFA